MSLISPLGPSVLVLFLSIRYALYDTGEEDLSKKGSNPRISRLFINREVGVPLARLSSCDFAFSRRALLTSSIIWEKSIGPAIRLNIVQVERRL